MGWSSAELHVLRGTSLTPAAWDVIVRVSVATSPDIAIAARHTATTETVDVIPQFGLDPGREYVVRIDASQIPTTTAATSRSSVPTVSRLTVPDRPVSAATQVTAIYPSAAVWPENILRFYLHFSQPMSGTSAVGHVRLVDDQGADIADALLEVDVDLWSGDYMRRTVFFDPGRVKRDIRPNREMGRALVAGRQYAIVVSREWRDSTGQSLGEEFRHAFTAGPAVEEGLQLSEWTLSQPSAGSRQDLTVQFPWPLDEGLLHRAVGVTLDDGTPVEGEVGVGPGERSWTFTPSAAWADRPHVVVVLTLLEDPSGNTVGEAFEFEMTERPATATTDRVTLPFRPR